MIVYNFNAIILATKKVHKQHPMLIVRFELLAKNDSTVSDIEIKPLELLCMSNTFDLFCFAFPPPQI